MDGRRRRPVTDSVVFLRPDSGFSRYAFDDSSHRSSTPLTAWSHACFTGVMGLSFLTVFACGRKCRPRRSLGGVIAPSGFVS